MLFTSLAFPTIPAQYHQPVMNPCLCP
jgi:hypothetical protein